MARRKSKRTTATTAKKERRTRQKSTSRAIWKGSISFGLVNIPVALRSAEAAATIDFDLLDRRDFSPIRYRRVSEKTGREVPWDEVIKAMNTKRENTWR